MLIIFKYYFNPIVLVDLLKNQIIIANDSVVYQKF
jgi:hypothetical protein